MTYTGRFESLKVIEIVQIVIHGNSAYTVDLYGVGLASQVCVWASFALFES